LIWKWMRNFLIRKRVMLKFSVAAHLISAQGFHAQQSPF
jgi:hypothetical protein